MIIYLTVAFISIKPDYKSLKGIFEVVENQSKKVVKFLSSKTRSNNFVSKKFLNKIETEFTLTF